MQLPPHHSLTKPSTPLFVHLRVHSAYSLAEGAIPVKKIPKLCLEKGMPAVGITDTANLFGALEIATACSDEGIQPIVGCELPLLVDGQQATASVVVLVQNNAGYANLLKLVSYLYLREDKKAFPFLTLAELCARAEGLMLLTGGDMGPLGELVQAGQEEKATELFKELQSHFKERLYIELMRHGTPAQERTEPFFCNLARTTGVPLVATNNVFFGRPSMYEAHDALLCIADGAFIEQDKRRRVTPHHYFKTAAEMAALFEDIPEAIHNTVVIAQRCHFSPTPQKPILPVFPTQGITEAEMLRASAAQGLEKRLQEEVFPLHPSEHHDALREQYHERLVYELGIIERMGFPGYFLIVADFIQWAKSQGIPVGPGRGSGAGSLVAWVTTITDMDPIRFNLLFERFLNPERVSMPDFDVDFCQDRRDEVINYVCQRYGADRVAHIITFGKLQARAVLRDVGRVLQMPYSQVDRICKLVPNNPANPITLEQALELEPELKRHKQEDETVERLINIGLQLEGLYRHASTHAAGVVIGDRPLDELIPLYYDERASLPVTQFNMKYVEAAGLVKFDFLGLKTLTVIEKCCAMVRLRTGEDFRIHKIPLDDQATFALLGRVETVGIFQLESAGMRDVLRKLQPDRFEDLIALVALYRPGPMDDIPRYLTCKHGQEEVTYLHPSLESILAPTYGVMVYQEQVMQIAQTLGGYTLGAADLLRRAMGKKIKAEMDAQRALFTQGAIQNGVTPEIASQIFDQMAKFAGYGFNKSHSAPYALLAYQTAYLKANYPQEFFAATMTYDLNNTDKLNAYRQDMQRMGLPLLPPDITHSQAAFGVEGDGVRYGLAAIKNVGEQAMEVMANERAQNGAFSTLKDFATRMDPRQVNKRQLENLIAAGAFDTLHTNRHQLFENIDEILSYAGATQSDKSQKQNMLFSQEAHGVSRPFTLRPCDEWSTLERLQKEFEALGFYLSAHPLDVYQDILPSLDVVPSFEIGDKLSNGQGAMNLAGIVLAKQERTAKSGQKFAFVTLSDRWGVFEVTLFSEMLSKARDYIVPGKALYIGVSGRSDGETYRLTAQSIEELASKTQGKGLSLVMTDDVDLPRFLKLLDIIPEGNSLISLTLQLNGHPSATLKLGKKFTLSPDQRIELMHIKGMRTLN